MSKSRGNVITPDEVIADHGADTLRVYELFIGPFHQDVMWDRAGIAGASRFVRRLYGIVTRALAPEDEPATTKQKTPAPGKEALDEELRVRARLNRLIGDAGEMIEAFRFNILVAQFMALLNELEEIEGRWRGTLLWREVIEILVRLIAPITPFLAEEAWHGMGRAGSVHLASWPRYDAALARPQTITLVIQVNGKVRDRIQAPAGVDADEARRIALGSSKVRRFVDGKQVAEVIVVPGRLVNVVVK